MAVAMCIPIVAGGARRLIPDRHTRDHHSRGTDSWWDDDRRRTNRHWLSDDHARQRWERNTDSDTDVDSGMGEGHAACENRCN